MRISDWSSDVCSSDLEHRADERGVRLLVRLNQQLFRDEVEQRHQRKAQEASDHYRRERGDRNGSERADRQQQRQGRNDHDDQQARAIRSEEHTSELQSLIRITYAVFCLKKKNSID